MSLIDLYARDVLSRLPGSIVLSALDGRTAKPDGWPWQHLPRAPRFSDS